MGFLSRLFGKKDEDNKAGGMEDYMQLVRVYFQASIAANVGITNLAMLPDLRVFKSTLHVQTVNNKLGLGAVEINDIIPYHLLPEKSWPVGAQESIP